MDLNSSSCFLCHDPLPSIGLSYSFLLEPGSVFDSLCDLLQLPWLKSKEFCKIENSELCQVCLIQMQDVVNTIESIKMLEIKLDRLRYEMENTIRTQYCFDTSRKSTDDDDVRLSKNAINLSRLLVQYWSQCQVEVRRLTEDELAQLGRHETHDESEPETEQFECMDIKEEFDEKISQITSPVATETEDSQENCTPNETMNISAPSQNNEDNSNRKNEDSAVNEPSEDSSVKEQDEDSSVKEQDEDSSVKERDEDSSVKERDEDSSVKERDEDLCQNDPAAVVRDDLEEKILSAPDPLATVDTQQAHIQNKTAIPEEKHHEISVETEIHEEIPFRSAQDQATSSGTEESQEASLEINKQETISETSQVPLPSLSTPQFEISELPLTHIHPAITTTPSLKLIPETDNEKTVKPGHYSPSMRLQCKFCSRDFLRQSNLTVHIRKYHEEEGESVWPSCKKCGLDFKASNCFISTGSRKNNVLRCNLQSCRYLTFKTIKELLAHHRAECSDSKQSVIDISLDCSYCGEIFSRKNSLDAHEKEIHARTDGIAPEQTKCVRCDLDFTNCKIQTSPSKRPEFQCKLNDINCTKNFRTLAALRKHHVSKCTESQEEILKKPRLIQKCPQCDLEFELEDDLNSHIKSTHDEGDPMLSVTHACDQCRMSFENQFQLRRHILSTHSKKLQLKCQACNAEFRNHYQLQNHIQSRHVKEWKCEQCHATFADLKAFIDHRRSHTDPGAQYVCEICGNCFNKLAKLNAHRARLHSDGNTVPCPDCGKYFRAKQHMWSHVYRVHRKKAKITLGSIIKMNNNGRNEKDEKKTEDDNDNDALKPIEREESDGLINNNGNNLHNQVPEESPLSPTAPSTVVKEADLGILTLGHDALMDVGVEVEIPLAERSEFELLNQEINH